MKTNHSNQTRNQGSVLVVTMSILAVAMILLASYLVMVQNQAASVSRSQTWNSAISLAEAGMEDGMAMVNLGSPSIIIAQMAWTNTLSAAGWTITNGTNGFNASRSNNVYGSNYYLATISLTGTNPPSITSAGVVQFNPIPWVFSSGAQPFLATIGGNGSVSNVVMGRKIQVQTVLSPLFAAGLITRSNFDMAGNNCTVDSFDSSSSTYSTSGQWVSTKRKAGGDVATDSAIVGDISLGNGNIYGSVYTGPGTVESMVQIGPNGQVGDLTWSSGIQPGHWFGNFNQNIRDVSPPSTSGWATSLPAASNSVITLNGGTNNRTIVLVGTNYVTNYTFTNYVVSSSPITPLYIAGPTYLWVQGSFSDDITIASTNNASLVLIVGRTSGTGDTLSLGGNGQINAGGYAAKLQFYGLPSLTSISMAGNAGCIGTVYAPEANFSGGGGGNNAQDCSGAMIVNSISLNGHWNFHYDENLKVAGPSQGWIATGWKEVSYP